VLASGAGAAPDPQPGHAGALFCGTMYVLVEAST